MSYKELPMDYVLVLQQINDDGGDNVEDLIDAVRVDRSRLQHIIAALHHKGLITVENLRYGTWLNVSRKGQRLMQYLWPETELRYRY